MGTEAEPDRVAETLADSDQIYRALLQSLASTSGMPRSSLITAVKAKTGFRQEDVEDIQDLAFSISHIKYDGNSDDPVVTLTEHGQTDLESGAGLYNR